MVDDDDDDDDVVIVLRSSSRCESAAKVVNMTLGTRAAAKNPRSAVGLDQDRKSLRLRPSRRLQVQRKRE